MGPECCKKDLFLNYCIYCHESSDKLIALTASIRKKVIGSLKQKKTDVKYSKEL